jgi:hypothetical protein
MLKLKVKYRNDDKADGKYLISRGTQDCIHIHLASIDSAMQQKHPKPRTTLLPLESQPHCEKAHKTHFQAVKKQVASAMEGI